MAASSPKVWRPVVTMSPVCPKVWRPTRSMALRYGAQLTTQIPKCQQTTIVSQGGAIPPKSVLEDIQEGGGKSPSIKNTRVFDNTIAATG